MNGVALRTEGLTKDYGRGRHRALDGLDLEVRAGEVYGFLGPNGAGKTTTIRLLLDLLRPTAGRVEVLGRDPRRDGVEVRRRIGYLPGDLPLRGRDSAGDLLTFLGHLRGGVPAARVRALADRFELDLRRPVRELSKGNRQKVGIVQAFAHDPELLILDEPTSGLDPLQQQEFLRLVREARAAGRTVFMSSHVLGEVQEVADRAAVLRAGRLVAVEDVDTLRARAVHEVELHFDAPVPAAAFADLPDVRDVSVDGATVRAVVEGRADALVKAAARFTVLTVRSHEPDLEDAFLAYYAPEEVGRRAA
jgi:ABC-2 type transport system ATP-binding protein